MDKQYLCAIDEKAELLENIANYLWENPETAFTEFKSAAYLCDVLRAEGYEAPIPKDVVPKPMESLKK